MSNLEIPSETNPFEIILSQIDPSLTAVDSVFGATFPPLCLVCHFRLVMIINAHQLSSLYSVWILELGLLMSLIFGLTDLTEKPDVKVPTCINQLKKNSRKHDIEDYVFDRIISF